MKQISVKEAVGMVLAHDMTQIIPGKSKGVAFKKGHIIESKDIPQLMSMGKDHVYILELKENVCHEDQAASRMAKAASGVGVEIAEPKEGKVELTAAYSGLLKINVQGLQAINRQRGIVFATIHTNQLVQKGDLVGGTKIIPLTIEGDKIKKIEDLCKKYNPIVEVKPFQSLKAGILITGTEVFEGRIQDGFGPVLLRKFQEMACTTLPPVFAPDDKAIIAQKIRELIDQGAEILVVSGGMSVDPDDVTPTGIKKAGAKIVTYGAPMLPGSMLMLAYLGKVPILGLPGCVMFNRITIFDLILQRILAGETVTRGEITKLGHGGICLKCAPCTFPNCGFGKGGNS